MDVSKRLYVCNKRIDVFYTLMGKTTRRLVSPRRKGVNGHTGPEFWIWAKTWKSQETKSLDILKFKKWSKNIVENVLQKIVT